MDISKNWIVPVEKENDEIFFSFPDDLTEAMNWKEGDLLMWSLNEDGSWNLQKVKVDE